MASKSKAIAGKGHAGKAAVKTPAKASGKSGAAKPAAKKVVTKKVAAKPAPAKKPAAKSAAAKSVPRSQPKKAAPAAKPKSPTTKVAAKKAPAGKVAVKKAVAKNSKVTGKSQPVAKKAAKPVVKPVARKPATPVKPSKSAARPVKPGKVAEAAPVAAAKGASPSSASRLFKGKVASATAMVTPRTAQADAGRSSTHKSQKNSSSSMNKLAAKKLDNGVTREDGRYALPSTSTITLPKGYRPGSDEEYMNPQHLAYFRNKLRDWRDQLVEESRQTMDNLREEVRDVGDEAERATRETENSLELRTRDRYRKLISKIDKALRRIEDGSYGFCEETDEEIGVDRLDARPIATLSLDAQERREHLQKQMGD